jgi:tetratricopeptide (TPR) repeat protein
MLDFDALKQAKQKTAGRDQAREDRFLEPYNRALEIIAGLSLEPQMSVRKLKEAADALAEAIEIRRTLPQPYVLMAFVFFCMRDYKMAFKYIRTAEKYDPQFPKTQELKAIIQKYTATEAERVNKPAPEPEPVAASAASFDFGSDFSLPDL